MAGRDGDGKKFVPGSRKYDRSIDDALRTMERFAAWLENAKLDNVWVQADDPLQVAMLHGMMTHLRDSIDEVLAQGGDEIEATAALLHSFAGRNDSAYPLPTSPGVGEEPETPPLHRAQRAPGLGGGAGQQSAQFTPTEQNAEQIPSHSNGKQLL